MVDKNNNALVIKKQLLFLASCIALLFIFLVIVLIIINPKWKVQKEERFNQTDIHLYIDESASMFNEIDKESLIDFITTLKRSWQGQVKFWLFADQLKSISVSDDETVEYLEQELSFLAQPTRYSLVEERLFFSDSKQFHFIISDYRFRDGFRDANRQKVGYTNIFYIKPDQRKKEKKLDRVAAFFLNSERINIDTGLDRSTRLPITIAIEIIFYSDKPKSKINYELVYYTPVMLETFSKQKNSQPLSDFNLNPKVLKRGNIFFTDNYKKELWQVKLPNNSLTDDWAHIGIRLKSANNNTNTIIYQDNLNIIPQDKRVKLHLLNFAVNKNSFLIKNALDRYKEYEVKSTYLGEYLVGKNNDNKIKQKLQSMLSGSDIFVLISPPAAAIDFFTQYAKNKKTSKAFIYIPSASEKSANKTVKLSVDEFDFNYGPVDFLDDKELSREKWQEVLVNMKGITIPVKPNDLSFHRNKDQSAFFVSGKQIYLGIQNLFFLNQNILADSERSFADIFLIKLINYVNDNIVQSKEKPAHNFFLTQKITDIQLQQSLPHLLQDREEFFISPSLEHRGVYPAGRSRPPYTYRIPIEEYFPPPLSPVTSDNIEFKSFTEVLTYLKNIKQEEPTKIVQEIAFRDLPYYPYFLFILIVLFLFVLAIKWLLTRINYAQ